jgi:hypothetical protein
MIGAREGDRTLMDIHPADFKSAASTSFTTRAFVIYCLVLSLHTDILRVHQTCLHARRHAPHLQH